VLLQRDTFEALVELMSHGRDVAGDPRMCEQAELLRSASVVDQAGTVHPSLVGTLAAIRRSETCRMELTQRGETAEVWVSFDEAAMLLPFGDRVRKLTHLPVSVLPEGLARLVDLSPRPRPAPRSPLPLQRLLAEPVRRHWLLSAWWTRGDGEVGGDSLEVVDTEGGLWSVVRTDHREAIARPSDATVVWRSIIRLVRATVSPPSRLDAAEGRPTS
jgi:hypothetical protein